MRCRPWQLTTGKEFNQTTNRRGVVPGLILDRSNVERFNAFSTSQRVGSITESSDGSADDRDLDGFASLDPPYN
jgi:hypothetical protein